MNDLNASEEAKKYIKENAKLIIQKYANLDKYSSDSGQPVAIFMAGSPGAGKTEFSKELIRSVEQQEKFISKLIGVSGRPVRIDADEIREELPQYTGDNSHIVQGACALAVEKILDSVFYNDQNFILDGTSANYGVVLKNVQRALKHRRIVEIFYIYQDPLMAWKHTQARDAIEHRNIPKDAFIDAFFDAKDNVNKIKGLLKEKIKLNLIIKDYYHNIEKTHLNIDNIDSHLKVPYTRDRLEKDI